MFVLTAASALGGLSMYANIAGHIPGKTEVIKPDF